VEENTIVITIVNENNKTDSFGLRSKKEATVEINLGLISNSMEV
jgi:hypothetical protein